MNNDRLSPNLRGLIHVLVGVLIRDVERELAEEQKENESQSNDDDGN